MIKRRLARIIPVIDIMDGAVVRAIGGQRNDYQPISSKLINSHDPLRMIKKIVELFSFTTFYIADLDAIMGVGSNKSLIEKLVDETNCDYIIDGGYKTIESIQKQPRIAPVIATETFEGWDNLDLAPEAYVSIDTKEGAILTAKPNMSLEFVLNRARSAGVTKFIHIRLEAVGTGGFDAMSLIPPGPFEKWYAGGGVGNRDDLFKLTESGYEGAFVSSAIHDGRLP